MYGVGIDGCKGGWVAVRREHKPGNSSTPRTVDIALFSSIKELWRHWRLESPWASYTDGRNDGGAKGPLVLIDIPIGLSDEAGTRECDRRAASQKGARTVVQSVWTYSGATTQR